MKSLSAILSKKNILIAFLTYIIIISVCGVAYYSNINIYGNLKIKVCRDDKSITNKCLCTGTTITQQSQPINLYDSVFILHESLYLNNIAVKLPDKSDKTKIIITDIQGKKLDFSCNSDGQLVRINSITNNYSKIDIVLIPYFNRLLILLILLFTLNFLCAILLFDKITKKRIIIVEFLALPFYCYLYQIIVLQKAMIYSGVLLILSLFIAIITIIWYLSKKHVADKNKRNNIILIFSSFLTTIIFVEIILRLFGIGQTHFEQKFGYYRSVYDQNEILQDFSRPFQDEISLTTPEFSYKRKVNSLGLSDKEPQLDKELSDFLIIGLGDSFTEGDGAHADSTWLKFLERQIISKKDKNYKFINAGICGSDPFYEYKLLNDKLLVYKPDIVIVAYGFDLTDVIFRGGMERFETNELALSKPVFLPLYSNSYIFRLIIHKIFKYDDYLMSPETIKEQTPRAITQLKESLILFKNLAKTNNFELIIVFYPQKDEIINKQYLFSSELIEFAKSQQIECLNLLEYYLNYENMNSQNVSDYFWKNDGHHNAAGYEKFANGVLWKLSEMGY